MSDLSQVLIGLILTIIGIGSVIVSIPRNGKTAWFVGKPFLEPGVPILIIATLAIGIILVVSYFTTIDDATLVGTAKHL